jgi:hypothetical protein
MIVKISKCLRGKTQLPVLAKDQKPKRPCFTPFYIFKKSSCKKIEMKKNSNIGLLDFWSAITKIDI